MLSEREQNGLAMKPNLVMKIYLVTYRIEESADGEQRDLGPLYIAIQGLNAFARPMESVWVVSTTMTADQLYKKLAPFFNDEDRLLVVECAGFAEWHGIPADTSIWLEDTFVSSVWLEEAFSPSGRSQPRRRSA